jgi:hypothetical protein
MLGSMEAEFIERAMSDACIADLTCQIKKEATEKNTVQVMDW